MWNETTTIEQYIDTLPNTTTYIDLFNKGLTFIPSLTRFTKLMEIILDRNSLTHLPELPNGVHTIFCDYNKLESIEGLPDSVRFLYVEYNNITHIHKLPNGLRYIRVSYNCLQTIDHLPPLVYQICCVGNPELNRLPELPNSLLYLICNGCGLTHLPKLPNTLSELSINENPIWFIEHIPDNLCAFSCYNTPIIHTLNLHKPEGLTIRQTNDFYRTKINKLQRARELHYTLKLKDPLRYWLWVRVRLPKIEQANHPDMLAKHMLENEDKDIEEVMDNFGNAYFMKSQINKN